MSGRTSPRRGRSVLGFFHQPTPGQEHAGTVFGGAVARAEFTRALLEHGSLDGYEVFTAEESVRKTSAELRRMRGGEAAAQVRVHSSVGVLGRFGRYGITAWHETGPDACHPFHVRRSAVRAAHPITLMHHTVSYRASLHEVFLRLLLQDVRPFDSMVCSSTTARTAFQRLLEQVRERLERHARLRLPYRGRLDVIPIGVDTEALRPADPAAGRAALGLPKDAFVLLWVGRLSAEDKADLLPLLRMFAALVHANPGRDLVLVLAGRNRRHESLILEDYARALGIADRVRFVVGLRSEDKRALYTAADVFVSPSDNVQEMFGITPVEAMACGVPQIVSDWDGYTESVVHGTTGFRVPTYWTRCDDDAARLSLLPGQDLQDHLSLAHSVAVDLGRFQACAQALLDNPALRATMARRSRERAVQVFGWPTIIARYEALWRELAGIAHRTPRTSTVGPPYEEPGFFDAFRDHATVLLADDARVRLTAPGLELARGRLALPAYHASPLVLVPEVLDALLADLGAPRRADSVRLGELCHRLAGPDLPPARVRRHLMWLLKYGFVELTALGSSAVQGARWSATQELPS